MFNQKSGSEGIPAESERAVMEAKMEAPGAKLAPPAPRWHTISEAPGVSEILERIRTENGWLLRIRNPDRHEMSNMAYVPDLDAEWKEPGNNEWENYTEVDPGDQNWTDRLRIHNGWIYAHGFLNSIQRSLIYVADNEIYFSSNE